MVASSGIDKRAAGKDKLELKKFPQSSSTMVQKKSLIVDDDALIRLSLKRLFEKEGFIVLTASSGSSALKIMEEETPDIVVLDVRLPDASGIDLLKTIKEVNPETVVIMITGHADIKSSVEAMKMGACDFLEKPLDFANIGNILRALKKGKPPADKKIAMGDFVFASDTMREVVRIADSLAAKSDVTILMLGESGTGKNLLCKRIHELSSRRDSWRSAARTYRTISWKANSSAMQRARSLMRRRQRRGSLNWPTAARCCLTRSATCLTRCSQKSSR